MRKPDFSNSDWHMKQGGVHFTSIIIITILAYITVYMKNRQTALTNPAEIFRYE